MTKRAPKPPPRSQTQKQADHAAMMVEIKAYLAGEHTGDDCPREPADQFKAPGVWRRQMIMHINVGGGEHLYTYTYTCDRCKVARNVSQ